MMRRTLLAGCSFLALLGEPAFAADQAPPGAVTDLGSVGTTEGASAAPVPSAAGDRAQAKEQKKEASNLIEVQPYTEIETLVSVEGHRWAIEDSFETSNCSART
ncbi:MAG: hypothetical protein WDN69_37535 [Aliidongia sp.]